MPNAADTNVRQELLAAALIFVRAALTQPGVRRIALIGSLCTGKSRPKDVDLLVTVEDDMLLGRLAALSRRLHGRVQQFNLGSDVFLAGPDGHYFGRLCVWRDCRPFIRVRCDADHCGQRPHLHDDLRCISLSEALIAEPPLELWPQVVTRVPAPEDVWQELIQPFLMDAGPHRGIISPCE